MKIWVLLSVLLFSPVARARALPQSEPLTDDDVLPDVSSAPAPPAPSAPEVPPPDGTAPPSEVDAAPTRAQVLHDVEDDPSSAETSTEMDKVKKGGAVFAPGTVAQRQAACDAGATLLCFGLGRTVITGLVVEVEDARINYKPSLSARTGLRGGWGVGFKLGLDFWDWVPVQVGVRHASPNDAKGFSEPVVNCTQTVGSQPVCDATPHSASTTTGATFLSIETGVEPSLRLSKGLALSPALFLGYAGAASNYKRSVPNCADCTEVSLDVNGSAAYLAPSLRLTWLILGLSVRYERYLSGDLKDAFAIALDIGARYKAVGVPLPGERENN